MSVCLCVSVCVSVCVCVSVYVCVSVCVCVVEMHPTLSTEAQTERFCDALQENTAHLPVPVESDMIVWFS